MTECVQLPRPIVNQLLQHAQQQPENEVCGLIGAKARIASHCYPISNIAATPQRMFAMDPAQQIAALRSMREAEEELFAIYHSHPGAPALPSTTDLAQASYPGTLYLIVSLQTRGVLELRAYNLDAGAVVEVALEIVD